MTTSQKTVEWERPDSDAEVWKMFDRIAPRYDLLNRVLSFRSDIAWRKRMARHAGQGELDVLDLATGTGDQILHLIDGGARVKSALGIDMAEEMLAHGRPKFARRGLEDRVVLKTGNATAIPCEDNSFDLVTITFGIRNVGDVHEALREMRRVLRPGGRALILEFSLPKNRIMRCGYLFYLRHILPNIGAMISGDAKAYRYLNRTIEAFPSGEDFCVLMRNAAMVEVAAIPLTFGIATIYKGDKAESVT
jgi:demethylmenaquinone methyltransferase/2-methoxy-6-polyprenyl-1,4-benzoquinol methylase